MSTYEPDEIGPWSVLVAEVIGGVTILTGYGPMPRSAAEAQLDVLGLCAYDEPLVPFSLKVDEPGITTLLRVSFGRGATLDLLVADRDNDVDPLDRWRRSSAELGLAFPEYPTHEGER